MAIKMNAKSKTLLTVLLVGSLCSLRASDMVEQEPKRLQITAATDQILDAIADVSTSGQVSAIQGTGFNTSTDSLVVISNNQTTQGVVALATSEQAVDILQGSAVAGTPIVGGATFTPNTNDLTSVSLGLSAMEGTGFVAGASLIANAQRTAANQVVTIANSPVLNNSTLTWNGVGTWVAVYTAINTALTGTTTQSEIDAITTAITNLGTALAAPTNYTTAQIDLMILQLQAAVTAWDALIPA